MTNTTSSGRLAGQVAVVTGAASGIGHAVVKRFVGEGARVVAVDRDPGVEQLAVDHEATVRCVVGDTTRPHINATAVEAAVGEFGRLDCFVGNVGVFDYFRTFRTIDAEFLVEAVPEFTSINLTAQLIGARCALDALTATGGSIIFTGSGAGTHPNGGGVLYTATKHALHGAVKQLAAELAPTIRVNAVAPGGTRTSLSGSESFGEQDRRLDEWGPLQAAMEAGTPLGALAEPGDHTSLYVLLAARSESRAMTGSILPSDGGLAVRGRHRSERRTKSGGSG